VSCSVNRRHGIQPVAGHEDQPAGDRSTRLITRSRGAYDRLALGLMLKVIWHPVHFGMQRRQLLNLKRRVGAAA
jgi:hypothetical protein